MALSSAFHERLHHMDCTRIQRLSLLQAEKELQASKSRVLASKLANISASEQRCALLDQKIASRRFNILALRSQIDNLEAKYESLSQELRTLQNEVEELEELRDKRDSFYEAKRIEMKEFRETAEKFAVKCKMEVESLRNRVNELRSCFMELKSNNRDSRNSEIAAAETRKVKLLAEKDSVCRNIDYNQQIKAQLQKQLQSILIMQTQDKGSEFNSSS
ncbi:protein FAM184A [Cajanus cajan]|uniref:protein FAM184A n=1 Tax=Cajanus cajan TaxID=3821 RepID=UPI00098DAD90|nr:protein FAM184A [Cajanus cajan]